MAFSCKRCGECCRRSGSVAVTPEEVEAIAGFLGIGFDKFIADDIVLSHDRRRLLLADDEDAPCRFLVEENGLSACAIEPVKPAQCRRFPMNWNYPGWEKICKGAK